MCNAEVYLGGTCNGSTWREELIPLLKKSYFNPVVDNWDEEAQRKENYARDNCKYNVCVITPQMTGVYGIAELVDTANNRPETLVVCFIEVYDGDIFDDEVWASIKAVEKLISKYPVKICKTLQDVADYINAAE